MITSLLLAAAGLATASAGGDQPHLLTNGPGQSAAIPRWDIQSTAKTGTDLAKLSATGVDTSSWHHTTQSRCTLMGCLLDAGVYKDSELWFSENLKSFDGSQFQVPWVYRNEFFLPAPKDGQHFLLETNGISSEADIFINGQQIANSTFQAGSYAGHVYDITAAAQEKNAIVVQVHPTVYAYDLAVGFVDWNPYPPDNGTGVWRDINVRQTGQVSMGPLSVLVDLPLPAGEKDAEVKVRAEAKNRGNSDVTFRANAAVSDPDGKVICHLWQDVSLKAGESRVVEFKQTVPHPQVWWPRQWGGQPMYRAEVDFVVKDSCSDRRETTFGIRSVTSAINQYNDTMFSVNGHPFQVIGAGYNADQFLRWDGRYFADIVEYMFDMGMNTIRLEGKMEQPELYEIADRAGLMIIAGWECCDKWESFEYNHDLALNPPPVWDDREYGIARYSMAHEAQVMQPHPAMLAYLIGSDYSPDERATRGYIEALQAAGWQVPILGSASFREPAVIKSGMKMEGPYDWVPPNYWHDVSGAPKREERFGSSFGFGSELGAGVGTPELGSLRKFLNDSDLEDLWKNPDKGLYHMSNADSQFHDRKVYNAALFARYGKPSSLEDYLMKAQLSDYEATRAQYEGYASRWSAERPATGLIYWMLNNAWPGLHWNQFDKYLRAAGSYFGTKTGARPEHVAYDYVSKDVWLINRSLDRSGKRTVEIEVLGLDGKVLHQQKLEAETEANKAASIGHVEGLEDVEGVVLLRLLLKDGDSVLSRNVYWLGGSIDELNWDESDWWYTPTTKYADYTALSSLSPADVAVTTTRGKDGVQVSLENKSDVPAFFVSVGLVDGEGQDVNPTIWSDNYVTLWPGEKMDLIGTTKGGDARKVQVKGFNVKAAEVGI